MITHWPGPDLVTSVSTVLYVVNCRLSIKILALEIMSLSSETEHHVKQKRLLSICIYPYTIDNYNSTQSIKSPDFSL